MADQIERGGLSRDLVNDYEQKIKTLFHGPPSHLTRNVNLETFIRVVEEVMEKIRQADAERE